MSTIREQILEAVKAALLGHTDAGASVFRSRAEALERQLTPALVVRWREDQPLEKLGPTVQPRDLAVVIEIVTRGQEPDALADPILVQVHRLLFSDATLGGLVDGLIPGPVDFEEDDADATAGITSATFNFRYLSLTSDPTRRL
ncbi:MAG: hypothetical protein JSS57_13470 [Proteobacteria bacterium]|nr:hypothetical protein [Pseudomonadota bacterium]